MNKTDYNKLFKEYRRGGTLLLHVCCAPCSAGLMPRLNGFNVVPYCYNPNIDTLTEYNLRASQYAKLGMTPIIEKYDHGEFLNAVKGLESEPEGGERCKVCIQMRLEKAAEKAAEIHADLFCSTLSVSPLKNAEFINAAGARLGEKYGVPFLPNDFKKDNGFLLSTQNSKSAGLYRQTYCGCEFGRTPTH